MCVCHVSGLFLYLCGSSEALQCQYTVIRSKVIALHLSLAAQTYSSCMGVMLLNPLLFQLMTCVQCIACIWDLCKVSAFHRMCVVAGTSRVLLREAARRGGEAA